MPAAERRGWAQREAIFLEDKAAMAIEEESKKGILRVERRREGEIVGGVKGAVIVMS